MDLGTAILAALSGGAQGFSSGYSTGLERKRQDDLMKMEMAEKEQAREDKLDALERDLAAKRKKDEDDADDALIGVLRPLAMGGRATPEQEELLGAAIERRTGRKITAPAPWALGLSQVPPAVPSRPAQPGGLFLPEPPGPPRRWEISGRGLVEDDGKGGVRDVPGGAAVIKPRERTKGWRDSGNDPRTGKVMQTYVYLDDESPVMGPRGRQTRLKPTEPQRAPEPQRARLSFDAERGVIVNLDTRKVTPLPIPGKPVSDAEIRAMAESFAGLKPDPDDSTNKTIWDTAYRKYYGRLLKHRARPDLYRAEVDKIMSELTPKVSLDSSRPVEGLSPAAMALIAEYSRA